MFEILQTIVQLGQVLFKLIVELLALGLHWALLLFWLAWALWGINWKKTWPVLAKGAWAPAVLALFLIALVWSQMLPGECNCLGFVTIGNFWWQLGDLGLIAAITLFCGWLQGVMNWTPAEINLDPPATAHAGHGHH